MPKVSRILVIDDDEWILRMVTTVLRSERYEVITAGDGEEGLATAQSSRPDLVLLDVMMPKMDGFEACRRLKADEQTRHIPVLMVTALDGAAERTNHGIRRARDPRAAH